MRSSTFEQFLCTVGVPLSQALTPLRGLADANQRLQTYERRLTIALAQLQAGENRMFTGVMCGSYHDVWMELHEDLVQLLGIDRGAEGSH